MSIAIIGGGIIGLLTARELVKNGHPVILIERRQTGQESSWAGGGILSPLYPWRYPEAVTRLAFWGQEYYPSLSQELLDHTGIDPEWLPSGQLVFPAGEDRGPACAWAQAYGVRLDELPADGVAALEPALAAPAAAWWLPGIAQIRPPRLLAALKQGLLQKGGQIREHCAVLEFLVDGHRLRGVRTTQGTIAADRCLVAAGAWTGRLLEATQARLPIRPVRGQMLVLQARPGEFSRIILKDGHYLIPRRDGQVLIGSTLEDVGFDRGTTEAGRLELWNAALALAPALAHCAVAHHWAGLRPGSPHGVPFIDRHPHIDGLYICAGHFRNGIVLGPASARLAADLLLQQQSIFDPAPYRIPQ